jgi:hypothetical protein
MQDWVATCQIEVRLTAKGLAKVPAVFQHSLHLEPCHAVDAFAVIFSKDIAMFAPLVTCVSNVPLKGKIRFHLAVLHT